MAEAKLRAVRAAGARSGGSVGASVAEAAASGSHRALLVAMRERIAAAVSSPDCPPRDLASLTRRLQDIAREIDALDERVRQEGRDGGVSSDETWSSASV